MAARLQTPPSLSEHFRLKIEQEERAVRQAASQFGAEEAGSRPDFDDAAVLAQREQPHQARGRNDDAPQRDVEHPRRIGAGTRRA
jgi:hypothetical protein